MATVFKNPLEQPAPGIKPALPTPLTPDQQKKYDDVLSTVQSWTTLPKTSAKNAETAPLSDAEKLWLTRECLLRYLRATKWSIPQAVKRLQETLVWRREYGTDTFTFPYISDENATGKQVIFGYDNEGRPCLYLLPNKQNTKDSPKQVQHLVFMLETTLELAPPGQETLALLIDFRNSSSGSNPSVGTARAVLHILQNHYPERLGRALVTHLPWFVTMFLKLVSPFIDPVTKTKIRYNEPLPDHIPTSQLMKNAGGECEFEYDHATYWPTLEKLVTQKRAEKMARFEKAGKLIGESEVYLWGGDEASVGSKKDATAGDVDAVVNGVEKLQVDGAEVEKKTEGNDTAAGAEAEKAEVKVESNEAPEQVKVAAA